MSGGEVGAVLGPKDPKTPGESRIAVRAIVDALKGAEVGARFSYQTLSGLAGENVRPGHRGYRTLGRARAALIQDHGLLFEVIPAVGLVRVDSKQDALDHVKGRHRKARKQFSKSRKVLAFVVRPEDLTPEEQLRFFTLQTVNEMLDHKLKPDSLRRIEAEVANSKAVIPPVAAIALFEKA